MNYNFTIPSFSNKIQDRCNLSHSFITRLPDIETQTEILSKLKHENLITYRCVLVLKKTSHLKVYLVRDIEASRRLIPLIEFFLVRCRCKTLFTEQV